MPGTPECDGAGRKERIGGVGEEGGVMEGRQGLPSCRGAVCVPRGGA